MVAAFEPPVTYDRESADQSVELNRAIQIARIDRDVRPASRHVYSGREP